MKYYRLLDDVEFSNRWYLGDINIEDTYMFTVGNLVDEKTLNNLNVQIDKDGIRLDYTETDADAVPIISEAFAKEMYEYKGEIQIIPISVPNTNVNYYILVVNYKIDCLDKENSDFQIYEEDNEIRPDLVGEYEIVNVLRIDTSKINKHIFRIEKYDIVVVVSDELKRKLESAKLKGIKFELLT